MQSGFVAAGREEAILRLPWASLPVRHGDQGPERAGELDRYRAMYEGGARSAHSRLPSKCRRARDEAGTGPGQGDALMRVAGWKVVTDGSNQGFTGRQREPYVGPTTWVSLRAAGRPEDPVSQRAGQGWPSRYRQWRCRHRQHSRPMEAAKAEGIDVNARAAV